MTEPAQIPPLQTSPVVHDFASSQVVLAGLLVQMPVVPAKLHAMHVLAHAVSQHTPLAQNPVGHWPFAVHATPKLASYRRAAVCGAVPLIPPAMRTAWFVSKIAVCP
ncbi:MAG: hypothetical protein H7210_08515 [Pyrinomonadaceae bacterium]|nr:hypothetical protein [Phycisphaerales bacterium]